MFEINDTNMPGSLDGRFVDENQQAGIEGTTITARVMNALVYELVHALKATGGGPEDGNESQILAAVQALGGAFEKWAPDDTDTGVSNVLLGGARCIAFSGSSSGAVWSGWVPSGPTGLDLVPAITAMMDADGGGNVKLGIEWYVVPPGGDYSVAAPTHTASITLAAPGTAGTRWEPDLSDLALPSSKRGTAYSEIKIKLRRDTSVDGNASAAFCLHRFSIRPVLAG